MNLTLRPVDPDADADLLHRWVAQPRAAFWGMLGKDLDEVRDIYRYITDHPGLAAYLVHLDGAPLALFQTYDPVAEGVADHYSHQDGDVGMHLFLADDPRRAGRTLALVDFFLGHVFADPAARRVVLEPDARNGKSLDLLARCGGEPGPLAELPHKTARIVLVPRPGAR